MPFLPGARALIELNISDRLLADTRIKQRARFVSLHYEQTATGESLVHIRVLVSLYAADGEAYGPALVGQGFAPYVVELTADNQTVVDAATGEILAIRRFEAEADWQAKLAAYAQPVMLQGDFFEYLRDNQAVEIGEMIRQHIAQADSMGRFA